MLNAGGATHLGLFEVAPSGEWNLSHPRPGVSAHMVNKVLPGPAKSLPFANKNESNGLRTLAGFNVRFPPIPATSDVVAAFDPFLPLAGASTRSVAVDAAQAAPTRDGLTALVTGRVQSWRGLASTCRLP